MVREQTAKIVRANSSSEIVLAAVQILVRRSHVNKTEQNKPEMASDNGGKSPVDYGCDESGRE